MAFGAPDHVRKQVVDVTDYETVGLYDMSQNIAATTHWTPVEITGVGSLGLIYFQTDYENIILKVQVDDGTVFLNYIARMQKYHVTFASPISNHAGVTRYDAVNDEYSMWVDFHYLLPFKRNLTIDLYNGAGGIRTVKHLQIYYKLRS